MDGMPYTCRNLHPVQAFVGRQLLAGDFPEGAIPYFFIEYFFQFSHQTNYRFSSLFMPVNRYLRTRKKSIQHPLRSVSCRIA